MAYSDDPLTVRLSAFAARRHGIVDSDELARAGVARSTVARWLESGRLFRLYLGVFSVVPPPLLTIQGRWLAAVKACGPGAALSHAPAGQHAGIVPLRERHGLHVSLRSRVARRPPGIVVHRPRGLDPEDVTTRLWIPTTTPTRTVWDLSFTAHRLPLPAVNVPLLGYTVDFLWESARFVVEADGGDHLTPIQRDSDNARDFALQRAGYLLRRYSSREMRREQEVVGEILGILRERLSGEQAPG